MSEPGKLSSIMPEDCSIWLEEKHPRVVAVLQWLMFPFVLLFKGTAWLSMLMTRMDSPRGYQLPRENGVLIRLILLAISVLPLVVHALLWLLGWLLSWLLRSLVGLFWHPTPKMAEVIARKKAESEQEQVAKQEEIRYRQENLLWHCPACGMENDVMRRECSRCAQPRKNEKPAGV